MSETIKCISCFFVTVIVLRKTINKILKIFVVAVAIKPPNLILKRILVRNDEGDGIENILKNELSVED